MKKLLLKGNQQTSQIYVGKGLLANIGDLCLEENSTTGISDNGSIKICILADTNTGPLFMDKVIGSFSAKNVQITPHIIKAGEMHKTLDTVSSIYDSLCLNSFGRRDMIIALGGGVVGDIAGFVAATFQRGMKHLVQIPTTLLAQVDSSVGGKCGVDLSHGKNLVGSFRQPNKVIIDTEALNSLSPEIYSSGMAEVIKYGCIMNPSILDGIKDSTKAIDIEEVILQCLKIKIKVVEEDEKEEDLRKILNFGHTIGHGVEKLGNYTKYSHGQAVAIGMAAALKIGEKMNITHKDSYEGLVKLFKEYNLPVEIPYKWEDVYEAILSDKKKQGDSIDFILMKDFGNVIIQETPLLKLKQMIKEICED